MRKILTILLAFLTVSLFGQDIKPISPLFKNLQSPSFSFMIGRNVWIYKGSTFNPNPWTELAGWKNVKDTLNYYVPYRNAHDTLITSYPIKTPQLILDTTHIHTGEEKKGTLAWDESTQSVETHISTYLHLNNGEELWVPLCVNNSGADILNGQPVYINSASGSDPTIRLASNLTYDESRLIGVATQDIPNGTKGRVTRFGYVNDIDLSSCTSGSNVYLGDKVLTHIRPTGGTFPVVVGKAIVCTTTGRLLVYPQGVEYTSEVNKVDGWPSYLQGEQTTLAFSDVNRTLSIIPVGSTFYFYQAGIKYIKTGTQTFQISDVEGLHYIYYNLGVYGELVNPSAAQITEGIRNYASISVIYWDATNKTAIYVGNERHTFHWPFWVRAFIHTSFWTQYLSGLGLTNITLGGGAVDADAQFGVDAGSIADEDIITSTPSIASITGLPIYYRSGAGVWRKTLRAGYSFLNDGTTGLAQYNLFSGGVWSLVSMTNNYYRLVHVFANNALSDNVFCVSGIAQYASATDAENGINAEINNIYSGALPFAEAKLIGCLILHTKTGLGNYVNARFVAIPSTNTAYKDFRKSAIQGYGGGGSGSLTFLGLSDTPDSYAGQASKIVGVSSLEQGVEFKAATIDNNGSINIPAGQTYNKGGVPIIQQTITAGTTTLTASQNAIKAYADTKEPLLTKGNLTAGSNKVSIGGAGTNALIGTGASVDVNEGNMTLSNIGGSVTDAQVPNTITLDNITQITNRSHTSLTDIGTNTHPQIDTFIASKGQNNGLATLDSGGKVPFAQLPATIIIYKGVWSPLTNSPTLTDGIGTAGYTYKANLSGSCDFGHGSISFYAGDWVMYNGTIWERSVGTDNVVSVNGQQGIVTLNTSHITENTNLYFTDARAQAAVVEDQINDGVTNKAPSENVVFDALAGKAPASGSGNYIWNGTSQQIGNFNISGNGIIGGNIKSFYQILGKEDNFGYQDYKTNNITKILIGSDININGNSDNIFDFYSYVGNFEFYPSQTKTLELSNTLTKSLVPIQTTSLLSNSIKSNDAIAFTNLAGGDYQTIYTKNIIADGSIQATTAKLTNLTAGFVPNQTVDGLVNSPIWTNGTKIGVNNTSLNYDFQVGSGSVSGYNTVGIDASIGIPSIYFGTLGSYLGYDYAGNERMIFNSRYVNSHYEFRINNSELMRLNELGNLGIGYYTGTEITNNKLAVNGSGYFSGTVNSTGYLLNGNNLFSSLSQNYLPYWDGTKFVNSMLYTNPSSFLPEVIGNANSNLVIRDYTSNYNRGILFKNSVSETEFGSITFNASSGFMNFTAGYSGWGGGQLFFTNGIERQRINSSGNVGIGYSTGTEITNNKLAVNGNGYFNGPLMADGVGRFSSVLKGVKYAISLGASGNNYGSIGYGYDYSTSGLIHTYATDDKVSQLEFYDGGFKFKTAPLGTTGNNINFTDVLTILNSGLSSFASTVNSTGYLLNGNNLFSSLSSNTLMKWDGTKAISISNAVGLPYNDGSGNFSYWNPTVQSLSGTAPTWNVNLGLGATITLSGNTSITLSNLVAGMSGTIFITNPSTAYYIKFPGYTADIKGSNLTIDTNGILCSGSSKRDSFGWYWNGTSLEIHVNKDYTRITW